ncbi:MFS general substrate transporter [Auriculariales sp. MPI-PUGE-AT-0066]|nr:MFS general substrate transporter [Auriculariales sp. MPI-PUGE-AT-0066]
MTREADPERAPLLRNESEDAADAKKRQEYGAMPWTSLWAIYFVNSVPGMAFLMILPFVNQMLLDNGVVQDPEEAGYYSGFVESVFAIVQLFMIIPVSHSAEIFGRKPVILIGSLGIAISSACFGLSKTYTGMLLSRALGGAVGGTWAITRVMLNEMLPRVHHATAFGGLSISYRIGQIIGLPLGGYLAHPERHVGLTDPFWEEYPFALPCFVGAAFAVLASTFGYFTIPETLKNPWTPFRSQQRISDSQVVSTGPQKIVTYRNVLTKTTFHQLLGCFLVCILGEIIFPLLSLWAFTPLEAGGLQLDEASIGTLLGIRSAMQIVGLMFMPTLERRFGAERLYKVTVCAWLFTFPLFPVANLFARWYDDSKHPLVWATILVMYTMWTFTALTWPCLTIMLNAASSSPEALTRLNALSQFTIVIPQAVGPAFGTSLFAFSLQTPFLHGHLVWVVLFLFACVLSTHAWLFVREEDNIDFLNTEVAVSRDEHAERVE